MKRIGTTFIALGAVIWTAGVAAWISGVWVTLPPDAVRFLVLSLSVVSGGALIAAGALIGRSVPRHPSPSFGAPAMPAVTQQLQEGGVASPPARAREGALSNDDMTVLP